MNILLHKQKLTKKQIEQLANQGIVAIQTDDPSGFQMVDVRIPQIELDDMVWACLDAVNAEDYTKSRVRLAKNLLQLAESKRKRPDLSVTGEP